jgi:hypothetical protein
MYPLESVEQENPSRFLVIMEEMPGCTAQVEMAE